MIPKGVRGNKRSQVEINKIKKRIRALIYSTDPIYTDEEILAKLKIRISERTFYRYKSQIWKEEQKLGQDLLVIESKRAAKRQDEGRKEGGRVHALLSIESKAKKKDTRKNRPKKPLGEISPKGNPKKKETLPPNVGKKLGLSLPENQGNDIDRHEKETETVTVDTSFDALNKLKNLVQVEVFRGPKPQVMKVY